MKERPILMNVDMVRAILDGRKTQSRRPVKPQPYTIPWCDAYGNADDALFWRYGEDKEDWPYPRFCPLGQPGDRLWVRETWAQAVGSSFASPLERYIEGSAMGAIYRATPHPDYPAGGPWRPSIHMPRWAARIILEITGVRVDRLQNISEADARAEGAPWEDCWSTYRQSFEAIWCGIYGAQSWDTNPWVWVIEFRRAES